MGLLTKHYVCVKFSIDNNKQVLYEIAEQIRSQTLDRMVELVPQDASGKIEENMAIIDINPNGSVETLYVHPWAGWQAD